MLATPRSAVLATVIAVLGLAPSGARAEAEERRIAVLQFTSRKVNADLVEMLADRARQGALAAAKGSPYSVMTRENTVFLVKQNGGVCTEGECEVETGKLIGAALVLTGSASFLAKTWVVDLKIHDTDKGRLVGATSVDATSEIALLKATLEATRTMVGSAIEALRPPAPPPAVAATPAPPAVTAPPAPPPAVAPPPAPPADGSWLNAPIPSSTSDGVKAEQLRTKCLGGDANACTDLGYAHERGTGVAQDDARAASLYQRGCDRGSVVGCYNLGVVYEFGKGVARDDARAAELHRRACDGGDRDGCNKLGILYANGRGIARDDARAVQLYRRACDAGAAHGCSNLGFMHWEGRSVPRDEDRATELLRKGCGGGSQWGCDKLKELRAGRR